MSGARLARLAQSRWSGLNVMGLLQLPRKVYNNRELLLELVRFATRTNSGREEALARIRDWHVRKTVEEARITGREAMKGLLASDLLAFEGTEDQLRATPHFGVLATLAGSNLTRLDYVHEQCRLLLEMKEVAPRLGLGSKSRATEVRYPDRLLTGLELTQVWAVLHNWGHLFGTFATERGLLFRLMRPAGAPERDAFLARIPDPLRPYAEKIIADGAVYSFVHALIGWRLGRMPAGPLKDALVAAEHLYLQGAEVGNGDEERLRRLVTLYRKVRQLTYLGVQAQRLIGIIRADVRPNLVRDLLLDDGVRFEPYAPSYTELDPVLNALDRHDYEVFFGGAPAGREVLAHLSEFKEWWETTRAAEEVDAKLVALFRRPPDWPTAAQLPEVQNHHLRLVFPHPGAQWVRNLEDVWSGGEPWRGDGATFYYSFPPSSSEATLNVYARGALTRRTYLQVARFLLRESDRIWHVQQSSAGRPAVEQRFWRSLAAFLVRGLEYTTSISEGIELRPVRGVGRTGYAVIGETRARAVERLCAVSGDLEDEQRREELKRLAGLIVDPAAPVGAEQAVTIIALGQMFTYHRPDGEVAGEIDGVMVQLTEDAGRWFFFEVKESVGHGPAGQLSERLKLLGLGHAELRSVKRAAIAEVPWDDAASRKTTFLGESR